MKKLLIAAGSLALMMGFMGCGGAKGNDPGESYAPDMYYSRAYETYGYNNATQQGLYDYLATKGVRYNALPVPGTVARGDMMSYHLTNDSAGLNSAQTLRSPLDSLSSSVELMTEAERLYLVNCGICHGQKLDGNGPLWNGGNGPYPAAPRNLLDDYTKKLTDGHMFHVITFGIRTMGSYASQLRPDQRWWVIKYIREKQGGGAKAGADSTQAGQNGPAAGTTPTSPNAPGANNGSMTSPADTSGKK
jgi:mono/diheme cytochrome c family protein